jgi:nucleoside-diphosphate-sugar epimerase
VSALVEAGNTVRAAFRSLPQIRPRGAELAIIPHVDGVTDWSGALADVGAIVHLAGPAHAHHRQEYIHRSIVEGSSRLAEQAQTAGVTKFVFMSSIKAATTHTIGRAAVEGNTPAPGDAYGRAKWEAEQAILARAALRPIVLRPPLVCGPDAVGNFARLLRLADTPWPLPFAGLRARRNMIARDSLIGALRAVLAAPDGPTGVFHVADHPALTVQDMVAAMRIGLGRASNQFTLPGVSFALPAPLNESLEVDDTAFRREYGYGEGGAIDARQMLASIAAAWKSAR